MGDITNLDTQEDNDLVKTCEDAVAPEAGLDNQDPYEPYPEEEMESDFTHVDRVLDGMGQLLDRDVVGSDLTGNEKYALSVLTLNGYAGNEGLVDEMRKAGEAAYKSITEILKKISEFFKGEGKKQSEAAEKRAENGLEILSKTDKNKPVPSESKILDPDTLKNKLVTKGVEAVAASDKELGTIMGRVTSALDRLKNSTTVGHVGAVYQLALAELSKLSDAVNRNADKAIRDAEQKANDIRQVKGVTDTNDREVKSNAKAEQKASIDETKDAAAVARGMAVISRAINNVFNTIGNNSVALAGAKVDSNFKG